jgi:hypothetical protein
MTQPADILLSLLREDRGSVPEVTFTQHDCAWFVLKTSTKRVDDDGQAYSINQKA